MGACRWRAGEPGGALIKRPGEDSWAAYRKISSLQLEPGTLIQIRNGGGGGWGHRELITRSIGGRSRQPRCWPN